MRRLLFLIVLLILLCAPALASHADAVTNANTVNTFLANKMPYSVTFTNAQLAAAGYDTVNMTRNGTYEINIKSMTVDSSAGLFILYLNANWNGKSIRVNNPVKIYMPVSSGLSSGTETSRLRTFAFLLISYLDNKPLGNPINDDTLLIYPSVNGIARELSDSAWQTMRDNVGDWSSSTLTTKYDGPELVAATTTDVYNYYGRGIMSFNTSTLPDDSAVNSAVFSLYVTGKTSGLGSPAFGITGGTLASNTSIVNGDYDGFSGIRYASDIPYSSIGTGARNNWSLNTAGLSNISKNQFTVVFIRDSWDINNSYTGAWGSSSTTSLGWRSVGCMTESQRPYLEVIYTPTDTTPPASITGLTNITTNCNNITFSWTNPPDADYDQLQVWRNNTALSNLTNVSTSVLWEGLPENTAMTMSTHTCDLVGNCNSTWVNKTANTDICYVPPTPTPTPTPTATPAAGCVFVNLTGIVLVNSTEWEITEGNKTWGVSFNATQGNVSYYGCIGTPTPTATPLIIPWTPEINPPSPDNLFGMFKNWVRDFLRDVFNVT